MKYKLNDVLWYYHKDDDSIEEVTVIGLFLKNDITMIQFCNEGYNWFDVNIESKFIFKSFDEAVSFALNKKLQRIEINISSLINKKKQIKDELASLKLEKEGK